MGDVVEVSPEALHAHAAEVAGLMSQLQGATANAADTWDIKSFGVACIFVAQILQVWTDSAAEFVEASIGAGEFIAEATDAMADAYTGAEQSSQRGFTSISLSSDGGAGQ
ncbi:hypothetical protein SAMN05892883_1796 [Jatrophihabitans sp. GAS493]|uniref:hypothetical protein n=1 Tax=Jatrophihabitans sp. GAS493 TaxID=1907575 RepID=UPI000BB7436D|nr:hypothetical protein [Jatrophihabitans sp. GAS493]SOD72399.1 hypothetical protein SAMN05892883_1796 [Jatrophihabitans sp. GAS493]